MTTAEIKQTSVNQSNLANIKKMDLESADQFKVQDTTSLQNQTEDPPSNTKLQICNLDKIVNLTSSLQMSTTIHGSSETCKSLLRNLYNILVCKKLPATEKCETLNKKIEEFFGILEVLSESCNSDKIKNHNWIKDDDEIEIMTEKVKLKIEKIKRENSELLIEEEKLKGIAKGYENLKENEALMKILFFNCYNNEIKDTKSLNQSTKVFSPDNKTFKELKNFQSKNQKFIFKDLCDTFEKIIFPKTQTLLSSIQSAYNLVWFKLSDSIKSTVLRSFINFQGFYMPLYEIIENHPEYLKDFEPQQIIHTILYGFTKVSKFEQLPEEHFYQKRIFYSRHKEYFFEKRQKGQVYTDHTKNYHSFKEELKSTKILIISDNFGTGKTTSLKHFARKFKEDDNNLWISYIDAKSSSQIFGRIQKILSWNVDCLADFLVKILELSGIEVSIFKHKFRENQVILLWDNVDDKFQPILIDFAWNIKQLTENQQVFATQLRCSENFEQKFNKTAYKLIQLTTKQLRKFHRKIDDSIDPERFIEFCDSIELGEKDYENGRKVFIYKNILLYNLMLQAVADLKIDLDYEVNLFSIIDRIYKNQLLANSQNMTEVDEVVLRKFFQAHALKTIFGNELCKSLQIVVAHENIYPISSLNGIFTLNFYDCSADFHHTIFAEYFITRYIMDKVISKKFNVTTTRESKIHITILALIIFRYPRIFNLINNALQLQFKNPLVINKLQENLIKIIKTAQYWSIASKFFNPAELNFFENKSGTLYLRNDFEFWQKFYTYIPYEDENYDKEEMRQKSIQQTKLQTVIKNQSKEIKNKPTIKGETSMKKLNKNHEISNQLNEFLDDIESNDADDYQ